MSSDLPGEDLGFLSKADLDHACKQFLERWQSIASSEVSLAYRGPNSGEYLIISRALPAPIPSSLYAEPGESSRDELGSTGDGDEAAIHHSSALPAVEYHIAYSPGYRVPVLHFFLHNISPDGPKGIDAVYDLLVPKHQHEAVKEVGVLGGIGMTNHPVTDLPCFWVHPCNTAEAMAAILGSMEKNISSLDYLMLWIGLVGSAVGLSLPKELAIILAT